MLTNDLIQKPISAISSHEKVDHELVNHNYSHDFDFLSHHFYLGLCQFRLFIFDFSYPYDFSVS